MVVAFAGTERRRQDQRLDDDPGRPDAEQLAALDASVRSDVRLFLAEHLRSLAIPTVIVTHDRADAEALDGEIVVLERGAMVQRGRLRELAASPATAFEQFAGRSG